jgi:hypothetical protein
MTCIKGLDTKIILASENAQPKEYSGNLKSVMADIEEIRERIGT